MLILSLRHPSPPAFSSPPLTLSPSPPFFYSYVRRPPDSKPRPGESSASEPPTGGVLENPPSRPPARAGSRSPDVDTASDDLAAEDAPPGAEDGVVVVDESESDEPALPRNDAVPKGTARCPVCDIIIALPFLQTHVDDCLAKGGGAGGRDGGCSAAAERFSPLLSAVGTSVQSLLLSPPT